MMKTAGAFLILGTTTLWGMKRAEHCKNRVEQMKYIQRIITLIQSEISYSRTFIGEIFYKIGRNSTEPYRSWMIDMSKILNEFTEDTFENIWSSSIRKNLKTLDLSKRDIEELEILGSQIGFADIQVQKRLLDLYLNQLENNIRETYEQTKTKVRLYHCLGIMSGLFLTVLLF